MFGCRATLPIDVIMENASTREKYKKYSGLPDPDFTVVESSLQKVLEVAKGNIDKVQEKQKEYYGKKYENLGHFKIGQLVLKEDFTKTRTHGGKLKECYLGPYTISKIYLGEYMNYSIKFV